MSHCRSTEADIRKISKVLVIVFMFMILEVWGHYKSNSLSLLADSIHLMVDFLGFLVSLSALKWTQKKANERMSFGYSRVEIVGALFSILLIYAATGYLLVESYHKIINPKEIDGALFFTISVIGFFVNMFCLYFLHDHHEKEGEARNLNIRAAYIHVVGDFIQSIGVIIASIITIYNPKWVIVDIICTLCFSVLVLISTMYVVKDAIYILVERAPVNLDFEALHKDLMLIDNVEEVIRLHTWNLSANVKAVAVHLRLKEIWKYETGMIKCKKLLYDKFNFDYVTIEFDTFKTMEFVSAKEKDKDGHVEFDIEKLKTLPLTA